MMSWYSQTDDGVLINIRVVPRASKTETAGVFGECIRIRLQAPPVDGKANKALVRFLAKHLNTTARNISIVSGESSRTKRIAVRKLSIAEIRLLEKKECGS